MLVLCSSILLNFWLVLLPLRKGRLDGIWSIQYWSLSLPTIPQIKKIVVLHCSFAEVTVAWKAFLVCLKDRIFFWSIVLQKCSSWDISLFERNTKSLLDNYFYYLFTLGTEQWDQHATDSDLSSQSSSELLFWWGTWKRVTRRSRSRETSSLCKYVFILKFNSL